MTHEEGLIESYSAFDTAVQRCLDEASRSLEILDVDLTGVPLEQRTRLDKLATLLASPTFSLRILLHRASHVEASCPRLLALAHRFAPRCEIRVLAAEHQANENVMVIADATHVAVRFNHQLARGKYAWHLPGVAQEYLDRFDGYWEKAQAGPSGAPLGL